MGMNYYIHSVDDFSRAYHIGKRSAGWRFLFRAWPGPRGITSKRDWFTFLCTYVATDWRIYDEAGGEVPLLEFLQCVEATANGRTGEAFGGRPGVEELDAEGWPIIFTEFS